MMAQRVVLPVVDTEAAAAAAALGEGEAAATTSAEAALKAAKSAGEPDVCAKLCVAATTAEAKAAGAPPPPLPPPPPLLAERLLCSELVLEPAGIATIKSMRTPSAPAAGLADIDDAGCSARSTLGASLNSTAPVATSVMRCTATLGAAPLGALRAAEIALRRTATTLGSENAAFGTPVKTSAPATAALAASEVDADAEGIVEAAVDAAAAGEVAEGEEELAESAAGVFDGVAVAAPAAGVAEESAGGDDADAAASVAEAEAAAAKVWEGVRDWEAPTLSELVGLARAAAVLEIVAVAVVVAVAVAVAVDVAVANAVAVAVAVAPEIDEATALRLPAAYPYCVSLAQAELKLPYQSL